MLASLKNLYAWWLGLISVLIYIFLCYFQALYADVLLNIFYLVITFYGLYNWKINNKSKNSWSKNILKGINSIYIIISVLLSILIFWIISNLIFLFPGIFKSPPSFALLDSIVGGISITATYLVAKYNILGWYFFLIADSLAIYIYIQKDMIPTAILFVLYLIFAVYAIWKWIND